MTPPLLELDQVTKSFGAVRALRGVSLTLHAGEVHALLGENGAGKSTLIKIVTGALAADSGTLRIDGRQPRHLTPDTAHRLGIACIYQQPALFGDLTVAENIALRLEPATAWRRVDWPRRRRQAAQLLDQAGAHLSPAAEVRSLSMPEQQLVEIACVLGAGARIVIMDEPTASLTRQEQERLFAIVRDLRRRGAGVIYISHRLEEIFALADRVTVLRDGESVGTRRVPVDAAGRPGPVEVMSAAREGSGPVGQEPVLTETELIRLMIGREVSQVYPPKPGADSPRGRCVVSLRGLGCSATGIRNVSLDVHAGEILGLAGLVGAGRTELARILFGLTPADAGEILLDGRRVTIRSPREAMDLGIAYVPEDRRRHGVILDLPLAHNVTMASHRRLFSGSWLRFGVERRVASEFIRDLGIKAPGPGTRGSSLSGGNQQKVALARWLATRPRLLILDEPTQGVDVGAKGEIHRLIRRLAVEGLAVILVSSDLPEILGMSDRIAVLRGGTVAGHLPGHADAHAVMAAALGQTGVWS